MKTDRRHMEAKNHLEPDANPVCRSYKGTAHERNEDRMVQMEVGPVLVLGVFDGISGHRGGDEAAAVCAATVSEVLPGLMGRKSIRDAAMETFGEAHARLLARQRETPAYPAMGCTATLLLIDRDARQVSVVNVGDSAAFRIRKGRIGKLTVDDTPCGGAIDRGEMRRKEARRVPGGFRLTKWMGMPGNPVPRYSVTSTPGDVFLVSTDGLHGYLSKRRIRGIVRRAGSPEDAVRRLRGEAVTRGGSRDDITVQLYRHPVAEEYRPSPASGRAFRAAAVLVLVLAAMWVGFVLGERSAGSLEEVFAPLTTLFYPVPGRNLDTVKTI